jgi:hypothetical protein
MAAEQQTEIQSKQIKVRGKTIIFDSSIYYIPNLSVITIGETKKKFPMWALIIGVIGMGLILMQSNLEVGAGMVLVSVLWFIIVYSATRYGLIFVTNSGYSAIMISDDKAFLTEVYKVLYNIMNNDEFTQSYNINFDQRKIVHVSSSEHVDISMGDSDINAKIATEDLEL